MMHVDVDPRSGKLFDPYAAAKFSIYLGLITRQNFSIVIPSWDEVEETKKNFTCQDIKVLQHFM